MISRNDNRIQVGGRLAHSELYWLLAAIHKSTHQLGYKNVILDFSNCTAAFPSSMLALCAQIMKLRVAGFESELILPIHPGLTKLFINTNWAYFLDPIHQPESHFKGFTQVPVTQFASPIEQNKVVNAIVNAILGSMTEFTRADFAAIEWSLNEITDNVLTHAQSTIGGLVQLTTFKRKKRSVEFVVCDAGIGIPASLRQTHMDIKSDIVALERAVREGFTRDEKVFQGNGLFGSWQVCRSSGGFFGIYSGHAYLVSNTRLELNILDTKIPHVGTLVVASIDCSKPGVLGQALKFGGESHIPVDYIENTYESEENMRPRFILKDEVYSFGSRHAATPIRVKLRNLVEMCGGQKIQVDCSEIPLISSSFADEVFGKLFVEMGPLRFMQSFDFLNINSTVRSLIDLAIEKRTKTGL